MCLSRFGVRSISGLSRALSRNGRHGVHQLHFQQLHARHFVPSAGASCCARAGPPAAGPDRACPRGTAPDCVGDLLGEQRQLRQLRRVREARHFARARSVAAACAGVIGSIFTRGRFGEQVIPRSLRTRRAARACSGRAQRAHAPHPSCARRSGRAPHRLTGIVHDEVEPVARGQRCWQNASTLGVCRRSSPKISSRSFHSAKSGSSA
jgi:hypothetical protein